MGADSKKYAATSVWVKRYHTFRYLCFFRLPVKVAFIHGQKGLLIIFLHIEVAH